LEPRNSVFYALHKIVPKSQNIASKPLLILSYSKNLLASFVRWVNFLERTCYPTNTGFVLSVNFFCTVPGYEMPRSMQQGHQQQQEDIAPPGELPVLLSSVADPHHSDVDTDPDPTFILMRIRILASK
jgi:hypothetical protein